MLSADTRSTTSVIGPLAAAGIGARVGVLFAALDAIAAAWLTRAAVGGLDYRPQSATAFLASAVAHAVLGALVAAALASVARRRALRIERPAREVVARFATLGILLANAAHVSSLLPNGAIEIRQSLALSCGLSALVVLSLATAPLAARLAGIASPWTGAVLLGWVTWITSTPLADAEWSTRQAAAAAAVLACAAAALVARTALASARALSPLTVGTTLLLALAGGMLEQTVLDDPPEGPRAADAAQATNVILISLDTVRADHLSVYGYERDTTPFLREFARDAVMFERSTSAGDFTLASHASLFTGHYPIDHGARPDPDRYASTPLSRRARTLAEMLADRGWWTCGVVSNSVLLHPRFGLAQGFQHYDSRIRRRYFPRTPPWTLRTALQDCLRRFLPPAEFDVPFRGAAEINGEVLAQLDRRPSDRPFFLFVNYMDAHAPYRPPAPFDRLFAPRVRPMDMPRFREQKETLYSGEERLSPAEREAYVALYDGGIAYVDSQLRLLFERLKQLGLYEDALIIVTADHGEAFGEHASLEHGMSAYQEQVRVPLLIKRPRAHDGTVVRAVVNSVDIVPTVRSVLGLAPCDGIAGVALLDREVPRDRVVFSEHYPTLWHAELDAGRAVHQTSAAWDRFAVLRRDDGTIEVYDLDVDPGQEQPLPSLPPGAPDLASLLAGWISPVRARAKADAQSTVDALRGLGYAK